MADLFEGVVVFATAVRSRSFTAAAERLGISKSVVGKSIARLEARLGTRLFYRTTRKLSLTADGEAFFQACAHAIEEIEEAEGALASGTVALSGRLRIDMPAAFGRRILLPGLLDIVRPHPDLQLTLSFDDRFADPIAKGTDLVVRFGTPADQAGLVMRKLTEQRLCICASPAYLAAEGTPRTLADLGRHRCIVNIRRDTPFYWRVIENGAASRFAPPALHEVGDGDGIIDLAVSGFGLCQMPVCLVRRHLTSGRLVSVLDDVAQVRVPVHLLWPQTRHLVPRVRFVVDELVKRADRGELDVD